MSQYKNAKLHNVIRKWSTQQLIETLGDNGLSECCDAIRDKQIDGDTFMNLTEGQLVLWKNKLNRLQITRLWSVIQLAHERPEDFVRLDQPVNPTTQRNVTANSVQNKFQQFAIKDEESQEVYSNYEEARSEINKTLLTKPQPMLKPGFNKNSNPVLPNHNNRVQENQNKSQMLSILPPVSSLAASGKSALSTSQNAFDNNYLSMGKTALPTPPITQQNSNKSTLPTPPNAFRPTPQISSLFTSRQLPTPPNTTHFSSRDSDSSQEFNDSDDDNNQTTLQQMISKSQILRQISTKNRNHPKDIPQAISQRRLPSLPPSSGYSRPLPEPPRDKDPYPFRQSHPDVVATPIVATPPGAGLHLPGPPIGAVPNIDLDDEFDDFDEGYEYSDTTELFDYKTKPWFSKVNRKEAIRLLQGSSNGTFVVRPSKYDKYECSFSINYDNRIYNLAVLKHGSAFALGNYIYNTITEIVDKYCEENLVLNGPNNENCYVKLKLPRF